MIKLTGQCKKGVTDQTSSLTLVLLCSVWKVLIGNYWVGDAVKRDVVKWEGEGLCTAAGACSLITWGEIKDKLLSLREMLLVLHQISSPAFFFVF